MSAGRQKEFDVGDLSYNSFRCGLPGAQDANSDSDLWDLASGQGGPVLGGAPKQAQQQEGGRKDESWLYSIPHRLIRRGGGQAAGGSAADAEQGGGSGNDDDGWGEAARSPPATWEDRAEEEESGYDTAASWMETGAERPVLATSHVSTVAITLLHASCSAGARACARVVRKAA
jgi:hypothetical protein